MSWRVARSLDVLLAQLNAAAPRRSKRSDGSIGDTAHSNRSSDHNPWYGPGIVTARDFTHDPRGGLDCNTLAASLIASRDRRIKYVIWNRRICSGNGGPSPWRWRGYSGSNPHTSHLHLSVVASSAADDPTPWRLPAFGADLKLGDRLLRQGDAGADVKAWQQLAGIAPDDGAFGPATDKATRSLQERYGLAPDGVVGPATIAAVQAAEEDVMTPAQEAKMDRLLDRVDKVEAQVDRLRTDLIDSHLRRLRRGQRALLEHAELEVEDGP